MPKTKDEQPRDVTAEILKSDKIPSFYQIKFKANGTIPEMLNKKGRGTTEWAYGLIVEHDDDAKKHWKLNKCLVVEDAILPKKYLVNPRLFDIIYIPFAYNPYDEYTTFVEEEFEKAQKRSWASKTLVGKMFSVGVGDGNAYYVVTKATKTKVTIEWRGFCLDRWVDNISVVVDLLTGKELKQWSMVRKSGRKQAIDKKKKMVDIA